MIIFLHVFYIFNMFQSSPFSWNSMPFYPGSHFGNYSLEYFMLGYLSHIIIRLFHFILPFNLFRQQLYHTFSKSQQFKNARVIRGAVVLYVKLQFYILKLSLNFFIFTSMVEIFTNVSSLIALLIFENLKRISLSPNHKIASE